jgi:GntR family transcriptional regulator
MLHFQINPNSGVPVYRQIMEQIKYYGASGTLSPGDKLPSIRELAKFLSVNPTTIVKAYTELEHEKVIEMRHGKGAFLADNVKPFDETGVKETLRPLAKQIIVEAKQLGASKELVQELINEEIAKLNES